MDVGLSTTTVPCIGLIVACFKSQEHGGPATGACDIYGPGGAPRPRTGPRGRAVKYLHCTLLPKSCLACYAYIFLSCGAPAQTRRRDGKSLTYTSSHMPTPIYLSLGTQVSQPSRICCRTRLFKQDPPSDQSLLSPMRFGTLCSNGPGSSDRIDC